MASGSAGPSGGSSQKRKGRPDNETYEASKRDRQVEIVSRVEDFDAAQTTAFLDEVCRKWKLDDFTEKTYHDAVELAFFNFGIDPGRDIDVSTMGSYGFWAIDERVHVHEMEVIALYHKLREHKLLADPETLRRVTTCLEQVYYAKRTVLNAFQSKLSVHQLQSTCVPDSSDAFDLEEEAEARLGSWSLRFRWIDGETVPVQKLLLHLLDRAMERRFRRQGDWCFEPVVVDGCDTHAWRPVMQVKDWMYAETRKETNWEQWQWLTGSASTARMVVEYLTSCHDYSFPLLVKDRTTFAFANGVYRAKENAFYPHLGSTLPNTVAACKYFALEFPDDLVHAPIGDIPTPHLESIMDFQEWEPEVKRWLYVLVGRLLYDLNDLDQWQIIPFFKGLASSGKCFAAGTEILMHDLSVKRVEDIVPGDLVMGDDSMPRTVLDLARGTEELYEITSRYGSVMVTREHILCLRSKSTMQHVIEMTVEQYLGCSSKNDLVMYRCIDFEYPSRFEPYAFDVTPVPGPQPYFGFQTDGNQRFCLADGTVTHNSTITLKVAKAFYEDIDVGVMSNNIETKFGISQFHDKLLFVAPEIKSDLKIEQAEFQSIVSGEDITINIKNKTAFSRVWKTPGVLAGNEVPSWADNSGSIQRRVLLFDFANTVTKGDMMLGDKLAAEMPYILLKCNRMYLEAVRQWSSTNIWTVIPKYFIKTRDDVAACTNVLEAFLTSDDVVLEKGAFCSMDDFKTALKTYMYQNNFTTKRFTWEFFRGPLQKHGVRKVRDNREYQGKRVLREFLENVGMVAKETGNALG